MEWTVEMDGEGGFVRVVTRGVFNVSDHRGMVEDILSRPFWEPGLSAFFDHRQLDFGNATFEVMREATWAHVRNDGRIGDGKAALLVDSDASFGRIRQFEGIAGDQIAARMRVFRDEEAALAWVASTD